MSNFVTTVQKIFLKPHNNADTLELGNIGSPDGWQVVVKKGIYQSGDLVVYIGENSVVPEWILREHRFWDVEKSIGMLAGKQGNRVKAVKLRGEISIGIVVPISRRNTMRYYLELEDGTQTEIIEDQDVSQLLGITKFEPSIPTQMAGEVYNAGQSITVNYDVENIKNWPAVLEEGEDVQITEKLHGSLCMLIVIPHTGIGVDPSEHLLLDTGTGTGYIAVASKGLGAQGLCFKHNDANKNNVYLRATRPYWESVVSGLASLKVKAPVIILGEVFGDGIQDLKYGMKNTISFSVFDMYIGRRGQGRYLDHSELDQWCADLGLERVPLLDWGPFEKSLLEQYQGTKSVFDSNQVREGVVIKPVVERQYPELGRVMLKSINEAYLFRKGNQTEFN